MPATVHEARAQRRVTLAEWVTAVMSIFWSVWWGFFMDRVLKCNEPLLTPPLPFIRPPIRFECTVPQYLVINVLIAALFAFAYVNWLWNAQKTAYTSVLISALLRNSTLLAFSMLLLLSSIAFAGLASGLPEPLVFYGVVLTFIWPLVVLATLWREGVT